MCTNSLCTYLKRFGHICEYHSSEPGVKQYIFNFSNGYGASVSVVGGYNRYGDGKNAFELAVLKHGEICFDTPITNDVLAYQTAEEIETTLNAIQKLKGVEQRE